MKNYEVTLVAVVRKVIGIQAPNIDAASDLAVDSIDTTDLDLGDWEVTDINIDDVKEHYEEED
jgi:hypothetical protein